MNNDYSLIHVLKTLSRWKKQIILSTLLIAILTVVGSLMMDNYYKSTAILYAASPSLANPDPIGGGEKSYYIYGTGEDLDRLFSIANSTEVKNYLINTFDLASHYEVDTSSRKGKVKLMKKFNKLYETKKTKFDGLELSIEDTDPVKARDLVKAARIKIEDIARKILKQSQANLVESLKSGIDYQNQELKKMGDSLTLLKQKFEIYDSYAQAAAFAELTSMTDANLADKEAIFAEMKKYNLPQDSINKYRAKVAGLKNKKASISEKISSFNEGVLTVRQLEVSQNTMAEELAMEKERLKKLLAAYKQEFTAIHIVERESIPIDKSRPKRSLIVLGLTFLGFALSCLIVLFLDATRDINWKEIYAAS